VENKKLNAAGAPLKIGVLALQGAFIEHCNMLRKLDVEPIEIRRRVDFSDNLDGLIIPGGESTVMAKLLYELELLNPIKDAIANGLPTFGTCAGLILLSRQIEGAGEGAFPVLDVVTRRNAYGRQLGSFKTTSQFHGIGEIEMVFIRAPYVSEVYGQARVLAVVNEKVVAVEQGKVIAVAFHPELTEDTRLHEYFVKMIVNCQL